MCKLEFCWASFRYFVDVQVGHLCVCLDLLTSKCECLDERMGC